VVAAACILATSMTQVGAPESAVVAAGAYRLQDPSLSIRGETLTFHATVAAPEGESCWLRAWLSDEHRTLSEAVAQSHGSGTRVSIEVAVPPELTPGAYFAVVRIESRPLETEHVVVFKLRV